MVDADEAFALEWLSNGRNGSAAYKALHPRAADTTCRTEGSKTLAKPNVQAILERERKRRREQLQADADEAMEGITRIHRVNMKQFFRPGTRQLIPINELPDDVADCIKALKPTPFGISLVLHDKMKARELLAIDGGRIQQQHKHRHTFDPAKYLGTEPPPGDDE